ncbi:MAG: aspartate kinase [Leptonema illini]|jgi:aspartate kinase|uniref:Aspartokinase n=1 Tax=Leptonema illini TaxID=183 RepID=A0A833H0Q0_9LEPT|nr:MAG: aspartate kinase [Leptonema illini]PKL34125.1 MAG: aspartate kinase [Spirochaetae bacterium HGW-Spirochaetae-10]
MSLVVQKYGGTSVGDTDRIKRVANRIKMYYDQGHDLVIVVSAMGHTTDQLVDMAAALNPNPKPREMDVLLSTGEQVSIALLAMALDHIGVPAISFTGGQVRILTDKKHSKARIQDIDTTRLKQSLGERKVCIVAGFQGVDEDENITTLGRGGSDLSAVALAAALEAKECEIYTDVDGVYTTDPNKVPSAKKIERICYEEMLELARLGAGVLHSRSVEVASKYGVVIHVRSSFNNVEGTLVVPEDSIMEKVAVRGVTLKSDDARISVLDIPDRPGLAADLFNRLARADINVDMIVQSTGKDGRNTISFTVPATSVGVTREVSDSFLKEMGGGTIDVQENIATLSAVGIGMKSHSGVAGAMFEALAKNNINIEMISTSEIKITVVINKEDGRKALEAVHEAFELGK